MPRGDRWTVREGGRYMVYGDTFRIREELKSMGGVWRAAEKHWSLPATETVLGGLRSLRCGLRVKVQREGFCHEEAAIVYVDSADADREATDDGLFCNTCEQPYKAGRVKVARV